jgi:phospholipase/carboxylesterase
MLAAARVVTPEQFQPGQRYPLVVMLHGHGATSDGFAGVFFAVGVSAELIVCAPSGPHPVWLRSGQGRSWYPPVGLFNEAVTARREAEPTLSNKQCRAKVELAEQQAAESYVLAAIDGVARDYPVDPNRIFLVGHSEGGVLAYGLGLGHPKRFRGLVVIGARLRLAYADPGRLERAAGRIRVLVCHSPDDQAIDFAHGRRAHDTLRQAGIDSSFERYHGGHALTAQLVRRIAGWIKKAARDA